MFEALSAKKRSVILDTDIGPDCDDVGAIAVLIYYARKFGFDIKGVCNCTSKFEGNGTVDAIFNYCGMETPIMGQWSGKGFLDKPEDQRYNDTVAPKFSKAYREGTLKVCDHVTFYRKMLAEAEDDSIMLISIGMYNNLADLLDSKPDGISPLDGVELVKKKVYSLVSMACSYPEGREFNIFKAPEAAKRVLCDWPTDIYLSDFYLGNELISGFASIADEKVRESNPLTLAYALHTAPWRRLKNENNSYDLTAVQFAALGEGELYSLTEKGRVEFYKEEGCQFEDATRFVPCEDGKLRFMVKNVPNSVIEKSLNDILISMV